MKLKKKKMIIMKKKMTFTIMIKQMKVIRLKLKQSALKICLIMT